MKSTPKLVFVNIKQNKIKKILVQSTKSIHRKTSVIFFYYLMRLQLHHVSRTPIISILLPRAFHTDTILWHTLDNICFKRWETTASTGCISVTCRPGSPCCKKVAFVITINWNLDEKKSRKDKPQSVRI
jgi:hypothetical protein